MGYLHFFSTVRNSIFRNFFNPQSLKENLYVMLVHIYCDLLSRNSHTYGLFKKTKKKRHTNTQLNFANRKLISVLPHRVHRIETYRKRFLCDEAIVRFRSIYSMRGSEPQNITDYIVIHDSKE